MKKRNKKKTNKSRVKRRRSDSIIEEEKKCDSGEMELSEIKHYKYGPTFIKIKQSLFT
jgi:hypothetical protein